MRAYHQRTDTCNSKLVMSGLRIPQCTCSNGCKSLRSRFCEVPQALAFLKPADPAAGEAVALRAEQPWGGDGSRCWRSSCWRPRPLSTCPASRPRTMQRRAPRPARAPRRRAGARVRLSGRQRPARAGRQGGAQGEQADVHQDAAALRVLLDAVLPAGEDHAVRGEPGRGAARRPHRELAIRGAAAARAPRRCGAAWLHEAPAAASKSVCWSPSLKERKETGVRAALAAARRCAAACLGGRAVVVHPGLRALLQTA